MRAVFIRILFASVLGVLSAMPSLAFETGNELHDALNSQNDKLGAMRYIKGVLNGTVWGYQIGKTGGVMLITNEETKQGLNLCIAANVTVGQITDVVAKYLTDNPARRNMDASFLVLIALRSAFSC